MTDHHDHLDELASAYLDGELSDAEQARVATDEALRERADQLARVRDTLGSVEITIDPEHRDRAVEAALVAFDDQRGASSGGEGGAAVGDLASAARRRLSRRTLRLTGVAAAVALLALAVPLLGELDSGSNDLQVAGPAESAQDMSLRSDADAAGAVPEPLTAAPAAGLEHLGPFADMAELENAVRARLAAIADSEADPAAGSGATEGGGAVGPCAEQWGDVDAVALAALAELDGQSVLVLVRHDGEAERTLVTFDVATCEVLATQRL